MAEARKPAELWYPAAAVAVFLILTWLTESPFTGDAPEYADSLVMRLRGVNYDFIEPGHLLWRPLGYALLRLVGVSQFDQQPLLLHLHAVNLLAALAWFAGLVAILSCYAWLGRRYSPASALAGTLALIVTHSFLGFSQAGTSYIPALGLTLAGLWALAWAEDRPGAEGRRGALAGLLLACGVFMWLPFVLVLPGILAFGMVRERPDRAAWRVALVATGTAALVGGSVYLVAWKASGTSLDFIAWIRSASHGISGMEGTPRMAVGVARAIVPLGPLGVIAKRFLLHDPYNPVTLSMLVASVGWRLLVLHGVLLLTLFGCLLHWRSWRIAASLVLAGGPLLVFAAAWSGGDAERYLPLFPWLAFAVAGALEARTRFRPWPLVALAILVVGASNGVSLSSLRANQKQTMLSARLAGLPAPQWNSVLLVTTMAQDPVLLFQRTYEGRAIHSAVRHPYTALINPGLPELDSWRQTLARRILDTWRDGREVWVSKRGLADRPRVDWEWVEEPGRGVVWRSIHELMTQLEWGRSAGNEDGFVELLRSSANQAMLQVMADSASVR